MADADRLIEVFNEAKACPAGPERDGFLAESCGDDAELKEQVFSLLRAHEGAGEFLRASPARSPEIEAELARLKPEEAGERIGPYKLREQIGEGGFGVVWVAEQQEPVRRTVALKIIKLGMDTREVVARFEQERQALAMMDHPNIARVFDAGATEHGRPFFVMELVRGIKITDYCDQANLPTAERLALFITVCHAVQHAHQKGIIHRDLKPSNILVTLHDGVPVPKVIDFGVAKATQGRLGDFSIYTQFQQMIGTPLYMSPEQAEMSGLDVDTRTDIYALGVLLYELLTGRTPFDAEAFLKAGHDEMRRIIREEEPQKPSTALHTMAQEKLTSVAHHRASEPPKLIHAIYGDLDWLVMKCLEKDRTRRYETASAVATDLQRHLNNEPVLACPPSQSYRIRKLVQRNKLGFAAVGAVTAALFIGLGASTWMFFKEKAARLRAVTAEQAQSRSRQEAEGARQRAEAEAAHSTRRGAFMMKMWGGLNQTAVGRDREMLRGFLDQTAERVIKELNYTPELEAGLREEVGVGFIDAGSYTNAGIMFMEALSLRRKLRGETHPEVASAMNRLAYVRGLEKRDTEAITMFRGALALQQKLLGNEHLDVAESLFGLAEILRRSPLQQTLGEAELLARECLRVRENKTPDSWLTAATRHQLGAILLDEKKYSEAEALLVAGYQGMKKNQTELQKAIAVGDFAFISALPSVPAADAKVTGGLIRIAVGIRMRESIDRLAQLYQATGQLEKAAEWSRKLDDLPAKTTSGSQSAP